MPFKASLKINEKNSYEIDIDTDDADAVYRDDMKNLPSFYFLILQKECIGIDGHLKLPLRKWLMEWDIYSSHFIDPNEIPELNEEDPDEDTEMEL